MKHTLPPVSVFRNALIIFGTVSTVLFYLLRISGLAGGYFSTVISLIALCAALFALHTLTATMGTGLKAAGFRFILFGVFSTTVGELLWVVFMLAGKPELSASVPPMLFILTYILNFLGFLLVARATKVNVREFLGLIIGFGILGLMLFTISSAVTPFTPSVINSGFVLGDTVRIIVIALALQMVLIYQGGLLGRYWLSIFIGNIFILIGNFSSAVLVKQYASGMWPFTLIDLIFIGGYVFAAHGFYGIGDSIRLAQKKITEHRTEQ